MKNYEYLNNAYWEKDDKSLLKCIRLVKQPQGGRKKEVLRFTKLRKDGTPCPNYREVVETVGEDVIDKNTLERKQRKGKEEKEKKAVEEQKRKSKELEQLFNLKLQAFEIPEIKNSSDRNLRTRMRRAKNGIEVQALASVIIAKELGYLTTPTDNGNTENAESTE